MRHRREAHPIFGAVVGMVAVTCGILAVVGGITAAVSLPLAILLGL